MSTPSGSPGTTAGVRLEATIRSRTATDPGVLQGLDVLPPLDGALHVLLTPGQLAAVVIGGYEVLVFAAHPIGPLDPSLIMDDATAQARLDERMAQIRGGRRS
jgi:hypothetical protein